MMFVEPVELALCNWFPELSRRRLNKVPDMSIGSMVSYLNERAR
jgi:hypothetical protein